MTEASLTDTTAKFTFKPEVKKLFHLTSVSSKNNSNTKLEN
jgi:hypothetical protein